MAGASDIKAGEAYVIISAKLDELRKDLKLAKQEVSGWGKSFGAIGSTISSAFAGIGSAVATGIAASVKTFADVGSAVNDMAARTGLSAKQVQELGFAAKQSGADMDDLEKAAKAFVKGGGNIAQFEAMGESIAAISDPSERARAALDAFGKSGTKLIPMFAELKSLKASSNAIGPILTDAEVKTADALGDSFSALKESVSRLMQSIGAAFGPQLKSILDTMIGMVSSLARSIKEANPFGQGGDLLDKLAEWEKGLFDFSAHQKAGAGATSGMASAGAFARIQQNLSAQDEEDRKLFEAAAKKNADMWKGIDRGNKERAALIREFETPAERFLRKQQEITDAMKALNNNRVMGFVGEGEAAAQKQGLQIALARLRQEEANRIASLMPKAQQEVAANVAKVQTSAAGTFSGAGASLLGRGGDPILRETKEQTVELRKIRKAVETTKSGPQFS